MVRYLLRLAAAAALLLLLAAPALAQGQLLITDPEDYLDPGTLQRAAQPLVDRGAEVAVYLVQSGGAADFLAHLTEDGLVRNDLARSKMIAVYVALDERYSDIRFGDEWQEALGVNDNYDLIRNQTLNPGLSDGDFTRAIASVLGAIDAAIASPPSPNGSVNVSTTPLALGGLTVAAAAAGGYALTRRRRAAKTVAEAAQKLKEAREGVATVIATLGQGFKLADERAEFDKVSYGPADVARLTTAQSAARQRFAEVQTHFDDIGEGLDRYAKPTVEQLNTAAAAYTKVRDDAVAAQQQLAAVEQIRSGLDQMAKQAPGEIERAKKA